MAHQSLDHNEILNVRWATVDPNPLAQKREARRLEEQAAEAVRRALPADYVAELEGKDPEAKKRRKIEGSFGLQGYEPSDEIWYTRTKALEGSEQPAQLEAPAEQFMLEGASSSTAAYDTSASAAQGQVTGGGGGGGGGGIFNSSTVAALQSMAGGNITTQAAQAPSGPLVGYGSDDDSD